MHIKLQCSVRSQNLAFFRNQQPIFENVTFTVAAGQVLMVRGSNGTGKTSLLRVLAGFSASGGGSLQYSSAKNEWIDGPASEYQEWVGHANAMKSQLTALENLQFWSDGTQKSEELISTLELVGLGSAASFEQGDLSAGQKRRLALARLWLSDKPLWLLDEPTSNLDAAGTKLVEQMIDAHCERGGTAIIASHDLVHPTAQTSYIKLEEQVCA